jgi:hypothetical protein
MLTELSVDDVLLKMQPTQIKTIKPSKSIVLKALSLVIPLGFEPRTTTLKQMACM